MHNDTTILVFSSTVITMSQCLGVSLNHPMIGQRHKVLLKITAIPNAD
ncbi:MAG: hypothetical protein NHB32_11075 [Fischerella sp. CENA71]|nr:hypothetical protein [Fischerella sp. CENA71]